MPGAVRPLQRLKGRNNPQPTLPNGHRELFNTILEATNCRTSVEMIENQYASHIKTTLDAAAINVRKVRPNHNGGCPPVGRRPKSMR